MKIQLMDAFLTGHDAIDKDHRKIVDAINEVSQSIEAGEFDRCSTLLDDFIITCQNHFRHEERILTEYGYPGLDDHKIFHKELILKAKSVMTLCLDVTSTDNVSRCFEELATLLVEDVIKGDMQFVSFLIDKGIVDSRTHAPVPRHTDDLPDSNTPA